MLLINFSAVSLGLKGKTLRGADKMGKYFLIFTVQYLILTSCRRSLQFESVNTKTVEQLIKEFDAYEESVQKDEQNLKDLESELILEIDKLQCNEEATTEKHLMELETQLTSCEQNSKNQTVQITECKQQINKLESKNKTELCMKNIHIEREQGKKQY